MLERAGTVLATVIDISECHPSITVEWTQSCLKRYCKVDDVFQVRFLEAIVFRGREGECSLSADAQDYLLHLGMKSYYFLNGDLNSQPLPGAYLLRDGALHEVFRPYADTQGAFFQATR